jgi:hypothetical protein
MEVDAHGEDIESITKFLYDTGAVELVLIDKEDH